MTRSTRTIPTPTPGEIRALLERMSWTQKEAASYLGVTVTAMENYVCARRTMPGGYWLLLNAWARMAGSMQRLRDSLR